MSAHLERGARDQISLEATSGFEPLVQLLQSRALPLGDVALKGAGDGDRTRDFLLGKEMLYH
jgi:hypothetical protein